MKERGKVFINAVKKEEYMGIISEAFDNWHRTEWYFQPREEFDRTSSYSFLAYLRSMVGMANDKGEINVKDAKTRLREEMGEYFREEKFNTALWFFREGDWDNIK